MFAISTILVLGGVIVLVVWILRDLSRGQLMRPALAVLALAALSMRVIVSFHPGRR